MLKSGKELRTYQIENTAELHDLEMAIDLLNRSTGFAEKPRRRLTESDFFDMRQLLKKRGDMVLDEQNNFVPMSNNDVFTPARYLNEFNRVASHFIAKTTNLRNRNTELRREVELFKGKLNSSWLKAHEQTINKEDITNDLYENTRSVRALKLKLAKRRPGSGL